MSREPYDPSTSQADALWKIVDLLEAVHTDNPWRRATFILLGALVASFLFR